MKENNLLPPNKDIPESILKEALSIVAQIGGTTEQAVDVILRSQQAWDERTTASPDEPTRLVFLDTYPQDND